MEQLSEKAEELLETLWIETKEQHKTAIALFDMESDKQVVKQLQDVGLISLSEDIGKLTEKGEAAAANVVRRHRLAERLLADVLGTGEKSMHERACKFEHLIDPGLEESICTLLGHPKICPHGKAIPAGKCCTDGQSSASRLVSSLSRLEPGQTGTVAYVYATEANRLQKLIAMGVLPGAPVSLVQKIPSYVFQIRQTQFAVDREIADAIYVRLTHSDELRSTVPPKHKWRFGWKRHQSSQHI